MFSILIPTYNNLKYLKLCLHSIKINSKFDHQIIVHVNEGIDGTLDFYKIIISNTHIRHIILVYVKVLIRHLKFQNLNTYCMRMMIFIFALIGTNSYIAK